MREIITAAGVVTLVETNINNQTTICKKRKRQTTGGN